METSCLWNSTAGCSASHVEATASSGGNLLWIGLWFRLSHLRQEPQNHGPHLVPLNYMWWKLSILHLSPLRLSPIFSETRPGQPLAYRNPGTEPAAVTVGWNGTSLQHKFLRRWVMKRGVHSMEQKPLAHLDRWCEGAGGCSLETTDHCLFSIIYTSESQTFQSLCAPLCS